MTDLAIESVIPQLRQALCERDEAVLVAAPGAGKTTRVPLALRNEEWLRGQRIIMLEPRRLAAKAAAQRMALLLGEKVGETVGYRMRLDSKQSARTRILVVTEGILTRMLQSDPGLEGTGLLIFDEFHERSLDADLGLALSLYSRSLLREDLPLKVLLMSATLDSNALAQMLNNAPIIHSEGRQFPVDIRYRNRVEQREIVSAVADCALASLAQDTGSILAFLPGQAEIRQAENSLRERIGAGVLLAPLYGDLSLEQQQQAIAPAATGQRKIVLATTLAESSITIDGVNIVIDSGYTRVPQFDPRTGMTRLHTVRVSQASAEQRAGRAGRLQAGIAYRLWPQEMQTQLPTYSEPEIRQADLAALALQLLHWGVTPEELQWLDKPLDAPWQQARALLRELGACDKNDRINTHGQAMAALPLHPRLAHMLLRAGELGLTELACDIAALLSERDPLPGGDADITSRLALLHGDSRLQPSLRGRVQRLRQQAQQFKRLLPSLETASGQTNKQITLDKTALLLALAYPDRIAQQREPGGQHYRLSNGRSAALREDDPLRNSPWLAVAQLGGRHDQSTDRIFIAAHLDPGCFSELLAPQLQTRDVLEWQNEGRQLVAERQWLLGKLVVRRENRRDVDDTLRKQAALDWIRQQGIDALPWNEELRQWQARVLCLREADLSESGDSEWPDVSAHWLQENLTHWLLPFVGPITHIRQLQAIDLAAALTHLLPWPLPKRLDELAPTHYQVPTGSRIRIDYCQQPPVLAVKLQEMFGEPQTPSVAGGRVPLLLHLLSPARRPLQVTQDLASFWANAYQDVKKDMKGRYPKHPWPDDPVAAVPERDTRKRAKKKVE